MLERYNERWTKKERDGSRQRRRQEAAHWYSRLVSAHPSVPASYSFHHICPSEQQISHTQLVETALSREAVSRLCAIRAIAPMYAQTLSCQAEAQNQLCLIATWENQIFHAVICIIITLGHKFNALLIGCMEKNKSSKSKLWSEIIAAHSLEVSSIISICIMILWQILHSEVHCFAFWAP